MAIAIFNDADYECFPKRIHEGVPPKAFYEAVGTEKAYIRDNMSELSALVLPYTLDAEIGTFSHIGFRNDFTATLVKAVSFDKDRFFNDAKVRAERDLATFRVLQKLFPDDYSKQMPFYNLARFRGDEERFVGPADEVTEKLFYWNLAHTLREQTVVLPNGNRIHNDDSYGSDDRFGCTVSYAKKIEELFNNLDDNDWLAVFSVDEERF